MLEFPIAHAKNVNGKHIEVRYTEGYDPCENPRSYDNFGTMICFHGGYNLGDDHSYRDPDDAIIDVCELEDKDGDRLDDDAMADEAERRGYDSRTDFLDNAPVISLNLYLYDHSGITMNTTGFHCPWDSGQVGFIYVTWEDVRKEYDLPANAPIPSEIDAAVRERLKAEVANYDSYIRGEVYAYYIWDEDPELEDGEYDLTEAEDSCHGFLGESEYALSEAMEQVNP